jgi:glycosyltransferase involved in cell wall biosynthesis
VDIALIMHELLVEGGGERQCVTLAQALARRGHGVTLYTSAYDRANCFAHTCRDLHVVDVGRGSLQWIKRPLFLRGWLDMRHLARAVGQKHEVWNPHHWPAQWGALWLQGRLGGKVTWMCNDVPDFLRKARRPHSLKDLLSAPLYALYYLYDREQNRRIDLTLFLSRWAEADYLTIYEGATHVVRSGADPARFRPGGDPQRIRSRFGFKDDDFVLLWLGIFMPHRRIEDALAAVAALTKRGRKVKLLLAGSDRSYPNYLASLKRRVAELAIGDAVTFTGKVAEEEIADFYAACDAFLFPNDQQTWGLVVLEAMASGCVALVSTGAGVSEVLTDGENAVLFPPRSPQILASKIESILDQPDVRRSISVRGMELVRKHYNYDRYAEQMEESFRQTTTPSVAHRARRES